MKRSVFIMKKQELADFLMKSDPIANLRLANEPSDFIRWVYASIDAEYGFGLIGWYLDLAGYRPFKLKMDEFEIKYLVFEWDLNLPLEKVLAAADESLVNDMVSYIKLTSKYGYLNY